ncbi:MAG: hypothetical protein QM831_11970 [Kofleriaceae bacterium]
MKTLLALTIFCATAAAAPTSPSLTITHVAAGTYGIQKAGEDAGPAYVFVKVTSDKPADLKFTTVYGELGTGHRCASMTKLDRIAIVKDQSLRLDADKGVPYVGHVGKGDTLIRIDAVMDHQCSHQKNIAPTFTVEFGTVKATRAIDEVLPS